MGAQALWNRYKNYRYWNEAVGLGIDPSRMRFTMEFFDQHGERLNRALAAMQQLEQGAIANVDEQRMVGHYWLRDSSLAPQASLTKLIDQTFERVVSFCTRVHEGSILAANGKSFRHVLVIGIGGSALGPQLLNHAFKSVTDPLDLYFFDNTDADGMQRVLASIPELERCLCIVISKSGGTKETRNGQLVAEAAWQAAGLAFPPHAVAVTGVDSALDRLASSQGWLERFPMWDWVGGRTSLWSAVGLIPAALQGIDIAELLRGAREADELGRCPEVLKNPAALMALMWLFAGDGKGSKAMVVLPYRDRLELLSKYLQQLVMESLGKERDLSGHLVNQGLTVYGNKGSTDQHAYIQQLREGPNNFFACFIEVLRDEARPNSANHKFLATRFEVEPGLTPSDYLSGFLYGTRKALYENGRDSITLTVTEFSAYSLGAIIAVFERAVGIYAQLVNINAYHQPGVEAGKQAAEQLVALQRSIIQHLRETKKSLSVDELAHALALPDQIESIFQIVNRLSYNGGLKQEGSEFGARYKL